MTGLWVKHGTTWKEPKLWVKHGTTWKEPTAAYVKDGVWKQFYAPAAGLVVQTGSTQHFTTNTTAQTGTVSSTITVPVDADFVTVSLSAYHGNSISDLNTTGVLKFTKGGIDTNMVAPSASQNLSPAWNGFHWQCGVFYLTAPDTGTNKTLKWSWIAGPPDGIHVFAVRFWKGVDQTTPIRDACSEGANGLPGNLSRLVTTVDADPGDMIFASFGGYQGDSEGSVTSWDVVGDTEEFTKFHYGDISLAHLSVTSSDEYLPAVTGVTNYSEGGIFVIVMKPGSPPIAPTAPTASLLVSYTAGGDRNDFTGEVGFNFRPNADKAFTWIGCRAAAGNTGLHTVKLYSYSGAALLHTAQIDMTGKTAGEMVWASMPAITLTGGADYVLQKPVTSGGPLWANMGPTTLQLVTNVYAVYAISAGAFNLYTADNQYVGLDLGW